MSTDLIVSYDGTANDDDALALGKMLARTGASLALAYVRHSREFDPRREELAQHDAERRLEQGAALARRTPAHPHARRLQRLDRDGLEQLAEREGASVIVFGSDYRTPPGPRRARHSAQHLLEGGPVAVAVAAAGLRTERRDGDQVDRGVPPRTPTARRRRPPRRSPASSAPTIVTADGGVDLIVVGSQATAPAGGSRSAGRRGRLLNTRRGSVLVVPHGKPVAI